MNKPILVIGDACKDIFVYCHCNRLCPEAPVPVLDILYREESLGMAGNVWRNINDLGASAILVSNPNKNEVTKTRYVDDKTNHMFLRIDNTTVINHIEALKEIQLDSFCAIVISDYNKGFLTQEDITWISHHHPLTFLDTKKILGQWAEDITFVKINRKEYQLSTQFISPKLRNKIIETLGSDGCKYQDNIWPVSNVEIKNLSGAGDSFLAGLVVSYLQTNGNINKALRYANEVATKIVQKRGIKTVK